MNDFKIIARLMAAIQASEETEVFNEAFVDERVLETTAKTRDNLARKLQRAGLIEGLVTTEDIDNAPFKVLWKLSKPSVTLAGLQYMQENSAFRKAWDELKDASIQNVSQTISAVIGRR